MNNYDVMLMDMECDTHPMLTSMLHEQSDHLYATFGELYSKYRRAVAAWMLEISDYFGLHPTTSHAAIAYLDRLQPNDRFSRTDWQMLAISCILISAKYNECEETLPKRIALEEITEQRITNKVILGFEIWILMKMSWKLSAFTPMAFLSCYMTAGITFESDRCRTYPTLQIRDEVMRKMVLTIADSVVLEEGLKQYHASDVACSVVFIVREQLEIFPSWRVELTNLMRGTEPNMPIIAHIIRQMNACLRRQLPHAGDSLLEGVRTIAISSGRVSAYGENHQSSPEGKENSKAMAMFTSPHSVTSTEYLESIR